MSFSDPNSSLSPLSLASMITDPRKKELVAKLVKSNNFPTSSPTQMTRDCFYSPYVLLHNRVYSLFEVEFEFHGNLKPN